MSEIKQIAESDLNIIKGMDEKALQLTLGLARLRRQFLVAEHNLLATLNTHEIEMRSFIEGAVKGLGVDEGALKEWRLDLSTGKLSRIADQVSHQDESALLDRIRKLEEKLSKD